MKAEMAKEMKTFASDVSRPRAPQKFEIPVANAAGGFLPSSENSVCPIDITATKAMMPKTPSISIEP